MTDYRFPRVRTKSLKDQAYEILRSSVITGQLEPGRLHNEKDLAQGLGISRTPVREALLEKKKSSLHRDYPQRCLTNTISDKCRDILNTT